MSLYSEIHHACPECKIFPENCNFLKFLIASACPEWSWKRRYNDPNEIACEECDYLGENYSDDYDEKPATHTEMNNVIEVDNNDDNNNEEEKNRWWYFGYGH